MADTDKIRSPKSPFTIPNDIRTANVQEPLATTTGHASTLGRRGNELLGSLFRDSQPVTKNLCSYSIANTDGSSRLSSIFTRWKWRIWNLWEMFTFPTRAPAHNNMSDRRRCVELHRSSRETPIDGSSEAKTKEDTRFAKANGCSAHRNSEGVHPGRLLGLQRFKLVARFQHALQFLQHTDKRPSSVGTWYPFRPSNSFHDANFTFSNVGDNLREEVFEPRLLKGDSSCGSI